MASLMFRRISIAVSNSWSRFPLVTAKKIHSYEGDGKTSVTILNHEIDSPLMIDAYTQSGFRLNNGMSVIGPLALFPKSALAWDVTSAADITPESLAAFLLLEPKIDIIVIGVGDYGQQVSRATKEFFKKVGITLEILSTEHACTTFNFLNVERRLVAAALIPPQSRKAGHIEEAFERRAKLKRDLDSL